MAAGTPDDFLRAHLSLFSKDVREECESRVLNSLCRSLVC